MAQATGKFSHYRNLLLIGLFVLSIILLGLVMSASVHPLTKLSWWQVFRRCVSISSFLSLWWISRLVEKRQIRSYGFSSPLIGRRQFLLGAGLGILSLSMLFVMGLIAGTCQINITPDRYKLWKTLLGFLPVAVIIGVLEELIFRGFILQHLSGYSKSFGIIVSSAAYSLVHLKTPSLQLSMLLELGGLFILGLVLSLSYFKTHQLYMAVGLHSVLAYGSRVNKLLVMFPNTSLSWLVGTSRLVNGLIGWGILLALGFVVVRYVSLRGHTGKPIGADSALKG